METLLARALELGAEKAKAIDRASVVIDEWVVWKCQYGCALFHRDSCHPPDAPSPERTRKLLGSYSGAILLNGPKGKKLNEVALRLEGEAYEAGYYKAFAMIALTPGGGAARATGCVTRRPSCAKAAPAAPAQRGPAAKPWKEVRQAARIASQC